MDEMDKAQARQELYLEIALGEILRKPQEEPLLIHGKRRCLDCEGIIPQKRIMANPQAVRCIGCQTKLERKL